MHIIYLFIYYLAIILILLKSLTTKNCDLSRSDMQALPGRDKTTTCIPASRAASASAEKNIVRYIVHFRKQRTFNYICQK